MLLLQLKSSGFLAWCPGMVLIVDLRLMLRKLIRSVLVHSWE